MDFKQAAKLGSYMSKDYAEDLFRLLVTYQDISASEAASRLNLHIKTVQDFLEGMASLDILSRKEVSEKKRPYYRYTLKTRYIDMRVDLNPLYDVQHAGERQTKMIREKSNAGVRFSTSRDGQYISHVAMWIGKGRDRKERKINLSIPQGKFLFHLPFPSAEPLGISDIMGKAGVDESNRSEILDIVKELIEYGVIEESDLH
jgi:predicted transcriptional regulator